MLGWDDDDDVMMDSDFLAWYCIDYDDFNVSDDEKRSVTKTRMVVMTILKTSTYNDGDNNHTNDIDDTSTISKPAKE